MSHVEIVSDGDIFESGCEALVNPVNVEPGWMGALAGVFARRFPGLEDAHVADCAAGRAAMGSVTVFEPPPGRVPGVRLVINFPTVRFLGGPADPATMGPTLDRLAACVVERGIGSIAVPALGCGVGGLDWDAVLDDLLGWADTLPVATRVRLYAPRPDSRSLGGSVGAV